MKVYLPTYDIVKIGDTTLYWKGIIKTPDFKELNELFQEFVGQDIEQISALLLESSGNFSIVVDKKTEVVIINDLVRSYPLFYTKRQEGYYLTDDIKYLAHENTFRPTERDEEIFKSTGYLLEDKTFFENIFQTQAAEILVIDKNDLSNFEYQNYITKQVSSINFLQHQKHLSELFDKLAKKMVTALSGKQAIVPLSGGYDSRLLLALLVREGYKNICCFTYGTRRSQEVVMAKRICSKLGIKCIHIEYNRVFFTKHFDKLEFEKFCLFAGQGSSIPHIQDFLAVKYLKQNLCVEDDGIFIPGHSGDIFAGTHLPTNVSTNTTLQDVIAYLKKKHFWLNIPPENIELPHLSYKCLPYSLAENWSWKERQTKFIVNSCRVYEFYKYKFITPFWDHELLEKFKTISPELKNRRAHTYSIESNLYDAACFEVFESLKIDYKKPSQTYLDRVTKRIKSYLRIPDGMNNLDFILKMYGASTCTSSRLNGRVAELQLNIYKKHYNDKTAS